MTDPAGNRFMQAFQREFGLVVIEARRRAKRFCIVTGGAVFRKRALVKIIVTAETGPVHAQESAGTFPDLRVTDIFRGMAAAAVDPGMLPFQTVAGLAVIEGILIESRHIEFATMVIAMAIGTGSIPHFRGGMQAPARSHQGLDLLMTGKAFAVRDLVPDVVAFCTITDTFQMSMRLGQWTGRDLRIHRHEGYKQNTDPK